MDRYHDITWCHACVVRLIQSYIWIIPAARVDGFSALCRDFTVTGPTLRSLNFFFFACTIPCRSCSVTIRRCNVLLSWSSSSDSNPSSSSSLATASRIPSGKISSSCSVSSSLLEGWALDLLFFSTLCACCRTWRCSLLSRRAFYRKK